MRHVELRSAEDFRRDVTPLSLDGIEAAKRILDPHYLDYVSHVSDPSFAVSLRLGALLLELCRARMPTAVADLGSGFSSFVLRFYASEAGVPPRTVSADDSPEWLASTRSFLERSGLSTDDLVPWDQLPRNAVFDIVLHDLGYMDVRGVTLSSALGLLRPGGILILDDLHFPAYRAYVEAVLEVFGRVAYDLEPFTLDDFGRYAWAVTT